MSDSGLQSNQKVSPSIMQDRLMEAWIRPLQILELDEPFFRDTDERELAAQLFLKFMSTPGMESNASKLLERYRRISTAHEPLFAVPADPRILQKLVWPLRHAKVVFLVGNYLATISLTGIVAEMVAIFLFDVAVQSSKQELAEVEAQAGLFAATFEKLSQDRRVKVLKTL